MTEDITTKEQLQEQDLLAPVEQVFRMGTGRVSKEELMAKVRQGDQAALAQFLTPELIQLQGIDQRSQVDTARTNFPPMQGVMGIFDQTAQLKLSMEKSVKLRYHIEPTREDGTIGTSFIFDLITEDGQPFIDTASLGENWTNLTLLDKYKDIFTFEKTLSGTLTIRIHPKLLDPGQTPIQVPK